MHPAEKYIEDVITGKIPACYEVRAAYERHLQDLQQCKKKGWVFNPNYAARVIRVFELMSHYKGPFAGRPIILEPWQQAILWVVYGWRMGSADGPRRFRTVYLEVPKKNGKTTMLAGLALYHFAFDNESGAEVYITATKRDQAKICFNDTKAFIENSPKLRRHFGIHQNSIFWKDAQAKIQPLSRDTNTADGLNPSVAIVDEVHRHPDGQMIDMLRNSMATRSQPMLWEITTAGTDKESICYAHHRYTSQVNQGKFEDDRWFGVIYSLDEEDDWRDPASWYKANPNLGTGKSESIVEEEVQKAINDSSNEYSVQRYHFNIWVSSEQKWIGEERWNTGEHRRSMEELLHPDVKAYGGLDLGSSMDFNALTITFHHELEGWVHQKYFFWCPEERLNDRMHRTLVNFRKWVDGGFISEIPGNTIDTELLSAELLQILERHRCSRVAYDRYIATHGTLQAMVTAGIEVTEQPQTIQHLSFPTKELEKMIIAGTLTRDPNPVMDWMMGNVALYVDNNENIKINKGRNRDKKVDGPVSAVMSLAEYIRANMPEENTKESIYNKISL